MLPASCTLDIFLKRSFHTGNIWSVGRRAVKLLAIKVLKTGKACASTFGWCLMSHQPWPFAAMTIPLANGAPPPKWPVFLQI